MSYRLQMEIASLIFHRRRVIRTLQLGFGDGKFLEMLERRKKFDVMGIETAPQYLEPAREKLFDVHSLPPEEMNLKSQIFDFIHAVDRPGFYHNPERTCLELQRLLAPEGILYLALPRMTKLPKVLQGEWWGEEVSGQLWHFTAENASLFLQRLGFRIYWVNVPSREDRVLLIAGKQPNVEWEEIPRWVGIDSWQEDSGDEQPRRQAA